MAALSYYPSDLLEYALVELLVLRLYDAELDPELPSMYRRMTQARGRLAVPVLRAHRQLLHDVQRLVVEVTELTKRVDNALKVSDDAYWNRPTAPRRACYGWTCGGPGWSFSRQPRAMKHRSAARSPTHEEDRQTASETAATSGVEPGRRQGRRSAAARSGGRRFARCRRKASAFQRR